MKPSKAQVEAYEKIRQSGVTNMYDARKVQELSEKLYNVQLPSDTIIQIMQEYTELIEEYGIEMR